VWPCLRPLDQTARAVFPQAAFLRCSSLESSGDETGNEVGQSHETELRNQSAGWIPAPHRLPPALGQERVEAVLEPPVQPVKEPSHIRLALEVSPPTDDGIDPRDQLP
jgi:hypothetical protein